MDKKIKIGDKVYIKNNVDSIFKGAWGIVVDFDGEYYHVSIYGGDPYAIFEYKELKKY